MDDLVISGRNFKSRLFIGTGKFSSKKELNDAIIASGTELVTVALRRMDVEDPDDEYLNCIDRERILLVPNTSGARTADEAVRLASLARAAAGCDWVKLELTPEPRYLLPDPIETLKAAELLIKEGFIVLPYINADPVLALRLEETGCQAVMPLGAPIGTNLGLRTRDMIEIIIEQCSVPVIVDAGIGLPSHACAAMEMGASAVLVNTAVATAEHPSEVSAAFRLAVEAGRKSFLSSGVTLSKTARASSPLEGFIEKLKHD